MNKKILVGGIVALVAALAGGAVWAKSVLTGDAVRAALASQVGKAIGQPVTIGTIDASIFPRVTVTLGNVKIGAPNAITITALHLGTDLRALFSRRIEHANVKLTGGRIGLPLPEFTISTSSSSDASAPVQLVSIDEIVLSDVQVASGGRTLRGDIEVVPQGRGLVIRRIALGADQTSINVTGQISDFAGPVGTIAVNAGALDMEQLLAFVNDFTAGAAGQRPGPAADPGTPAPVAPPSGMNMALALDAESAKMGGLTLKALHGSATITGNELKLDPVRFGIFGGQYEGSLTLVPGGTLRFTGSSKLSNVDVAAAMAFAGNPNTLSGRLTGRLDFAGEGSTPDVVMKTVAGNARIDVVDGTMKHLGLVSGVVSATSLRPGSLTQAVAAAKPQPADEAFSKLGATLAIGKGVVTTNDVVFESKDVVLNAQGAVNLVSSTLDLKGRVQLSEALSRQASGSVVKLTQENGRITLPATVTGTIGAPSVKLDTGDMAKRALKNVAVGELERVKTGGAKAVGKSLGGLFGR